MSRFLFALAAALWLQLLSGTEGVSLGAELASRDSTVTGDSQCVQFMCISAAVNGSNVQYVMQSDGSRTVGWIAMGFGSSMVDSPMVIMWPNSDGTTTLSQRTASGHTLPTVDSSPSRVASISNDLTSTSGSNPKFGYTIPANSDTTQSIIWAFGTDTPSSSSADATFAQHLVSGTTTLNLAGSISSTAADAPAESSSSSSSSSSGSSSSGSSSSDSSGIPFQPYQRLIIAHAVFSSVAFLIFLPVGALLARYLRSFTPTWFLGHWIAQFAFGAPAVLTGFILGILAVRKAEAVHFDDNHKRWGLALFILYVVQVLLGGLIHFFKPRVTPKPGHRPLQNYFHAILGLLIIALALYQVRTGYREEWPNTTGRGSVPNGVDVVWYIWVVALPVLYGAGLLFLRRQFAQERNASAVYRKRPSEQHLEMEEADEHSRYRDDPHT